MKLFSARKTFTFLTSRRRYCSAAAAAAAAAPLLNPARNLLHFFQLSISSKSLTLSQQCHARVFTLGLAQNPFLATKLISAYAVFGVPNDSLLVFDSLQDKNVYLWNTMINGYVKNRAYDEGFGLFYQMGRFGLLPDDYTLATLAKVCGESGGLNAGRLVHGKSLILGFDSDVVVANSIMAMYSKCGEFGECMKVFDEMPTRNVGSWNVVLAGYADTGGCGFDERMVGFVNGMMTEGLKPDGFTVSSLLSLCSEKKWSCGRELHGFVLRNGLGLGLESDVHLGSCLIDMYSRTGKVDWSKRVFDQMKNRNVYSWTAMINGYVQDADFEEALVLFREMQVRGGVEPNMVTLVSVLPACSSLAGLLSGKQIHGYAYRKGLNHNVSLSNAVVDMYSKCGDLNCARLVFEDGSFSRDTISWSSMICGYGLHGKGQEAVLVFNKMVQLGNKPDMITLVGVLSACGRSGLVDEGLRIYHSAVNGFGIEPTVEICACVVDMFGRSGQLGQALDFIMKMPIEPGPSVWGALLSASIKHGNSELQDMAYRILIHLDPENPSHYISLSNVHASSSRWDAVAEVRTMMKDKGLKKTPGCSWISIDKETHYFCVADKLHPCSHLIYEMLGDLILLMRGVAYPPDLEIV